MSGLRTRARARIIPVARTADRPVIRRPPGPGSCVWNWNAHAACSPARRVSLAAPRAEAVRRGRAARTGGAQRAGARTPRRRARRSHGALRRHGRRELPRGRRVARRRTRRARRGDRGARVRRLRIGHRARTRAGRAGVRRQRARPDRPDQRRSAASRRGRSGRGLLGDRRRAPHRGARALLGGEGCSLGLPHCPAARATPNGHQRDRRASAHMATGFSDRALAGSAPKLPDPIDPQGL